MKDRVRRRAHLGVVRHEVRVVAVRLGDEDHERLLQVHASAHHQLSNVVQICAVALHGTRQVLATQHEVMSGRGRIHILRSSRGDADDNLARPSNPRRQG